MIQDVKFFILTCALHNSLVWISRLTLLVERNERELRKKLALSFVRIEAAGLRAFSFVLQFRRSASQLSNNDSPSQARGVFYL